MKSYMTVLDEATFSHVIERSEFIGRVYRIADSDDALRRIKECMVTYPQATHYCYAYVLGENASEQKMSDNGEPQGTAGVPILDVIKRRGLTYTLVVVIRYFGGIKLGAGGLVRAYSDTAARALDAAVVVNYAEAVTVETAMSYTVYPVWDRGSKPGERIDVVYGEDVRVVTAVRSEDYGEYLTRTMDLTGGRATTVELERGYYSFKE